MKTKEGSSDDGTETHDDAKARAEAIEKIRRAARILKESSNGGKNLHKMRNRRVALLFTGLNGSAKSIASKKFLRDILAEEGASYLFVGSRIGLGGLRIFVGCGGGVVSQKAMIEAEMLEERGVIPEIEETSSPSRTVPYTGGLVELPGGGFGTLFEYRQALQGADSPVQQ